MMRRITGIAVGAMALALVSACASATPPANEPRPARMVMSVDDVSLHRDAIGLTIVATGHVNSGGWSNPQLLPLQTFAPEIGIQTYIFSAVPPAPDEMVTQALVEVTATTIISPVPDDLREIKIMAEGGEVVVPVPALTP